MVNLHQTLIGRYVSRVDKYTERGIVINGIPNYQLYKQDGILKSVDDLKMSMGWFSLSVQIIIIWSPNLYACFSNTNNTSNMCLMNRIIWSSVVNSNSSRE